MAQRSRKKKRKSRSPGTAAAKPPGDASTGSLARGYGRSEARNAAVRAQLEPLAEGERPLPVTIGAITALGLVLVQIPLYVFWSGDERPALLGFLFFTGLMLLMAWGMWKSKYWAVLGFQALLALTILVLALALMVASTVLTALICLGIIIPAGTLFWFMVKALARIQMPEMR